MHETTRIFDPFGLPPAQRSDGTRPIQLHTLPVLVATFCQTLATRFHLPPHVAARRFSHSPAQPRSASPFRLIPDRRRLATRLERVCARVFH